MKRTIENDANRELVVFLEKASKKNKAPVWGAVARAISCPRRERVCVNLGKIAKLAPSGATVIVPGKILSGGELSGKLDIAALSFSASAKEKVAKAGGKLVSIRELAETKPKGSGVMIVK
jgi:large subunit ribosomal protein L18e